ncbi:MAG: DUF962 domain-containing protein [Candidatus Obscuribacterales bacterium]|nr:DUF962 domain-containing protein [Candidatus Obscuribacterales bacterium]
MGNNGCGTPTVVPDTDTGRQQIQDRLILSIKAFAVDYGQRHAHPLNAALHVVGVPSAFAGFFYFFSGRDRVKGGALIFLGYLLQYLGHRAQGNEVGEVTLAKSIYRKTRGALGLTCETNSNTDDSQTI